MLTVLLLTLVQACFVLNPQQERATILTSDYARLLILLRVVPSHDNYVLLLLASNSCFRLGPFRVVDTEAFGCGVVVSTGRGLRKGHCRFATPVANGLVLVCRVDLDILVVRKGVDCHTNDKGSSKGEAEQQRIGRRVAKPSLHEQASWNESKANRA
jgi:hypothetical protein